MTPLQSILAASRATSQTEREEGSYFEELIRTYFRQETRFANLYSNVWLYADWAKVIGAPKFGLSGKDTGIDLVAKTRGIDKYRTIRCKCDADGHLLWNEDIDTFLTPVFLNEDQRMHWEDTGGQTQIREWRDFKFEAPTSSPLANP